MSSNLQKLMNAFISTIIKYHDAQPKVQQYIKEHSHSRVHIEASKLIEKPGNELENILENLKNKCTSMYKGRKLFLDYLIKNTIYLKAIYENREDFSEKMYKEVSGKVYKMIDSLYRLLKAGKSISIKVYQPNINKEINLDGLLNDGFYGGKYCRSGQILLNELISCGLTETPSKNQISDYTKKLFNPLYINFLENKVVKLETEISVLRNKSMQQRVLNGIHFFPLYSSTLKSENTIEITEKDDIKPKH